MSIKKFNDADFFTSLCSDLEDVARDAGREIMEIYENPVEVEHKRDGSPVTKADLIAENIIHSALQQLVPDILVISEENSASHCLDAPPRFFLVDPLDGTREFLKRSETGHFTVNIALIENGYPVMGIVFAPALDRLFSGIVEKGAIESGYDYVSPVNVRESLETELTAVVSASHQDSATNRWLKKNKIKKKISIGSSLKFCLVASGKADVYPRFGPTMEWDIAAGHAILMAAGGQVVSPDGTQLKYGKPSYRNGAFIAWGG